MNLGIVITTVLYLSITGFFLYKFVKNNMSFNETIKDIKGIFSNCCIKNKKDMQEKIGKELTTKIETSLKEVDGDCKEPTGYPFDICFTDEQSKEDMILREKILMILKKRKSVMIDGGMEKLIVPLEATLFLTKSLNPLVSEQGDIQIVAKEKKLTEQLKEVMFVLKGKGEVIYSDEKELIDSIKTILDSSKIVDKRERDKKEEPNRPDNRVVVNNTSTDLDELIPVQEHFPPEEEQNNIIKKEIEDIILPEQNDFPPEEFVKKAEPVKKEEIKKPKPVIETDTVEDDPFGDPFGDPFEENDTMDMSDLNTLLEEELSELDFEQEDENTDILSFYKLLEYKTAKSIPLNFENISESITKLLSNEEVVSVFFKNLAKTKPIIFSDNKEVAFVDQYNVYFAISKIFGLDSKKYINKFKELKLKEIQELNKTIAHVLELYLSDLRSETKGSSKEILEKEGENFYSFGFTFQTNAFKTGLSQKEFDFFRSFPYNNDYKLKGNIDISDKLPKLISSINEVEIN